MLLVGILQGRLTKPTNGQLQCFPTANWEQEFSLARECGLECMELLVERHYDPLNPVYSEEGISKLKELSAENGVEISSICSDYFIERPLHSQDPNCRLESLQMLAENILSCGKLGAGTLVLPFFEKAAIETRKDEALLSQALSQAAPLAEEQGVQLALEANLPAARLKQFVEGIGGGGVVCVCYDTGNTAGAGLDSPQEILLLGKLVRHVHLKDRRKSDYANVLLGEGDADFPAIFKALKQINYSGPLVLETFRGDDPVATAKRHREIAGSLLRE